MRKLTITVTQNIAIYSNKRRARPLERKKLKSFFLLLQGQLIGVIGKVGSGKSSLLAAITAEMEKRLGEVRLSLRFSQLYDFEIVPGSIIKQDVCMIYNVMLCLMQVFVKKLERGFGLATQVSDSVLLAS